MSSLFEHLSYFLFEILYGISIFNKLSIQKVLNYEKSKGRHGKVGLKWNDSQANVAKSAEEGEESV